jgi:hypothetical protein
MEEPHKFLFRNDLHTYAVLDGASVPDLPNKLFEMQPRNVCLYRGELSADMVYVAPYLVHLFPGDAFAKWLLAECWGKHWGIFAQSALTLVSMRTHFRSLLTVYDESGNPLLFRFYDPRVFLTYISTCNGDELKSFFGMVSGYFAETEDAESLLRYKYENEVLKKNRLKLKSDQKP